MKYLHLLVLLLCTTLVNSQYDWPPKGEENKDYYINSKEKPDGLHYRTYGDGSLFYVGVFENGKPKPNTEFWYYYEEPSGMPMTLHEVLSSPDSIMATNYFPSGKVLSLGHYYKQKKDGRWKFYTEAGTLKSIETYKNDVLNGELIVYYDNDKIFRKENYVNGEKHGDWLEYFESGNKKTEGAYLNGKRDGSIIYYQSSGRIDIEGEYKAGLKNGTWTKYNSSGKIEIQTLYKEDLKVREKRHNGIFMDYYDNGIPKAEHEYVDGQKHGPFKMWFNKGEWVREQVKLDDSGALSYKEKLEGTQLEREGDYMDGELEGEVTIYNEKGQVIRIETYSAGELIQTEERH